MFLPPYLPEDMVEPLIAEYGMSATQQVLEKLRACTATLEGLEDTMIERFQQSDKSWFAPLENHSYMMN